MKRSIITEEVEAAARKCNPGETAAVRLSAGVSLWYDPMMLRNKRTIPGVLLILTFGLSSLAEEQSVPGPKTASDPVIYRIHSDQSKFMVHTGTAGLFGFMGHEHFIEARDFSGEITVTGEGVASLQITVKTSSLTETGKFDSKDMETIQTRLHENVMESAKYPEIRFQSSEVQYRRKEEGLYEATIRGDLDLHGVKRPIVISAQFRYNETSLRATGVFEFNREEFKIRAESAGGGTVKVSKMVDITFDIVAHR